MTNIDDINSKLNATRSQKFRKKTEAQIDGISKLKAFCNTPEYHKKHKKRTKAVAQRPEMVEWYKDFNKNKRLDPQHIVNHQKGIDKRTKSKEWQATVKRNKIQTPDGVFESRKAAAEFYNVKPPVINFRLKKYAKDYYYINPTNGSTLKYSKAYKND